MNNIATKLETITKIATDDIVTIVLGGLNLLEQRYREINH